MKKRYNKIIAISLFSLTTFISLSNASNSNNECKSTKHNPTTTQTSTNSQDIRTIEFGIYVLDIDEISVQNQNFLVNFFLILKWKDETLVHTDRTFRTVPLDKVWHPLVLLVNRQSRIRTSFPPIVRVDPDGTVTFRQQYVGPLSQRLRLNDFPLDIQTFGIRFALAGFGTEKIKLVPGNFSYDLRGAGMAKELSLPDWEILEFHAETKSYKVSDILNVPGFAFVFTAKRHLKYFLWQAMMPLVLIVMMSWLPFWVNPQKGELQFAIATSAVLTLIMFRYTLAKMLPALPYLTRMDLLTISSTLLVFAAFLQVACTTLLASSQKLTLAVKIDRVCRILFPLAFIFMIIWSMLL